MAAEEIENDDVSGNIFRLIRKLKELRFEIAQQVNKNSVNKEQLSNLAAGVSEAIGNLDVLTEMLGSGNEELKQTFYNEDAIRALNEMVEKFIHEMDRLNINLISNNPSSMQS